MVKVHRSDPNLHIVCEISGCNQSFSKVFSYKTHLYRKHKDFENNAAEVEHIRTLLTEETDDLMIVDEYSEVNNLSNNNNRRENAFFLLQVKEKNLLTQRCLDEIVSGTTELIKSTVTTVENSEPQRITVGHRSVQRRSGTRYREFLRDDEIMYIPLLEILQQLLNMDFVILEKGHKNENGFIEDYCDGKLFKAHPLFSKDPTALQLMFYYDELEITNPLGSKTGKHKLGTVYLTLGNIPPKFRSTLNSIQLLAVATYPIIKQYGIDSLFEPIMNDLAELEKDGGYQFMVKCQPMSFAGTIAFISADNLGAQLVGGFKESASANLRCRHCMEYWFTSKIWVMV
ncbi:uncharacterized protein LOC114539659 [Dendronephthya gigantea]|uniref:uncharacterized protein LOC114539659 n=1 Tax=Dendronephthya gigantea TaxID=151771 RepID=UPI00106CE289|nr:uncharacterized protein LOC114539659 [Dendronephthya gigantea]